MRRTCLSVFILVIITYASFSSVHFFLSSWSRLIAYNALTYAVSSISLSRFRFCANSLSLYFWASAIRVYCPARMPSWPFCSLYYVAIWPTSLNTLARSPGIFSNWSKQAFISDWNFGSEASTFFIFAGDNGETSSGYNSSFNISFASSKERPPLCLVGEPTPPRHVRKPCVIR